MDDPQDEFIETAAQLLDLPMRPEWKAAVRANLDVTLGLARLVSEFPLPDDAEPAPIFKA